jgi:hypothetical protein
MDWNFISFQSPLSLLVVVLLGLTALFISIWTYWNTHLERRPKILLMSLRASGLLCLLLVLSNPLLQRSSTVDEQHIIPVLLDQSLSTSIERDEWQGLDTYKQLVSQLSQLSKNIKLLPYGFDQEIYTLGLDSLTLTGGETDLAKAIGSVYETQPNAKAILLLSDGIYNSGRDPRFVSDRIDIPIFALGLGDTTQIRDLSIQNIQAPESGFKNTPIPVEVSLKNEGFNGAQTTVELRSNGKLLESKTVTFSGQRSVQQIPFLINPTSEGLLPFEILLKPVSNEWTTRNNKRSFSIDVQDNRLRILFLSFEVHPDVKVIQQVLDEDETISSSSLAWLNGDRFMGGVLPSKVDTLDLIVLYGFPHAKIPASLRASVVNLLSKSSYLLAASPLFDPALAMQSLQSSLPLQLAPLNEPYEVGLHINKQRRDHPILKFQAPDFNRAPRLFSHIRNIKASSGAEVLLQADFKGSVLDAPVLVVRSIGDRRTSVLNVFGYYTWNLNSQLSYQTGIQELLRNTILWTSTKPDDRLLIVKPTKTAFDSQENILLNAFVKDESEMAVTDGVVNIQIQPTGAPPLSFSFNNDGYGKYSLNLNALPAGTYSYVATAYRGSRKLDERSGQFNVMENVMEYLSIQRNDALLKDLSTTTNGAYYPWNQVDQLIKAINSQEVFSSLNSETYVADWFAYRTPMWFIIALILLTCEWLLRKKVALP